MERACSLVRICFCQVRRQPAGEPVGAERFCLCSPSSSASGRRLDLPIPSSSGRCGSPLLAAPRRLAIMSARKIGGGRVLGRAPPQQQTTPSSSPFPKRHSSLLQASSTSPAALSPSASSLSLDSSASTSHTSHDTQIQNDHLGSRISLDHALTGGNVAVEAAAVSARLICPICSEEMVSTMGCLPRIPTKRRSGHSAAVKPVWPLILKHALRTKTL